VILEAGAPSRRACHGASIGLCFGHPDEAIVGQPDVQSGSRQVARRGRWRLIAGCMTASLLVGWTGAYWSAQ